MIKRQLDPARGVAEARSRRGRAGSTARAGGREIGSGPGYFTLRLARAVGPSGRVYAVDPEPAMLDALRGRLRRDGVHNVTPVLGLPDDPLLPSGACRLALIVNAYNHFADGPALLRRLARSLHPRGRVVNIDWDARETPVGPPLERRIPSEAFVRDARRAGLALMGERSLLPHQYFLVLGRRRASRAPS